MFYRTLAGVGDLLSFLRRKHNFLKVFEQMLLTCFSHFKLEVIVKPIHLISFHRLRRSLATEY